MTHVASRHISYIHTIQPIAKKHLSVIILAAGVGKRMKSYGPKALLKYDNNITILDLMLNNIWRVHPKADISIVIGFQYKKFLPYKDKYPNLRLIYNAQHNDLNTMFSAQLGIQSIVTERVLILHGDLIFTSKTLKGLASDESKLVLCDSLPKNSIGIMHHDNIVTNIAYGLDNKWGQIAYITDREFQLFNQVLYSNQSSRLFLYEGLKYIVDNGGKFMIHDPCGHIVYDVDAYKDLETARENI